MGWRDALATFGRAAVDESRWVVLDVETTGLDPGVDRLLAVAAVAVEVDWTARRLAIVPGDSFEAVLRQEDGAFDRDNILLHGIGVQRQREGVPAARVLGDFAAYAGNSPLLAFHAAFDEAMIGQCARMHAIPGLRNRWLDIEQLCAVTHSEAGARSLDEWLDHFGIRCGHRHQAASDAWAECELLLRIWPGAAAECRSWRDVERLAARHRWIRG